jgi:hypothetical protein
MEVHTIINFRCITTLVQLLAEVEEGTELVSLIRASKAVNRPVLEKAQIRDRLYR